MTLDSHRSAQARAFAEGEAAADLHEQLSSSVVEDNLTNLRAVTQGVRMNLGTLVTDLRNRDALLVKQGGWRRAFVTSRRSCEQLRASLGQVGVAVRANALLMARMRRLARPVLARRLVMDRAAAKEQARHDAAFQKLLRDARSVAASGS